MTSRKAFLCLDEMRQKGEQVDLLVGSEQKARMGLMILIQVRGEEGPEIGCHRLVLAAVSPYFRAMFRAQVTLFISILFIVILFTVLTLMMMKEVGGEVRVLGVEGEALATIVDACYTGQNHLHCYTGQNHI